MTDGYNPGRGHPIGVDPTGRSNKYEVYDDEIHGKCIVMCSRPTQWCKNNEVYVKDYAKHLQQYHKMQIDPVQERLMKRTAMIKPGIRKSKYVWAPFPYQIPLTIYEMHLKEIIREKEKGKPS